MNAQDWAQLDRYKNANLTLDLDTVDMVFMGDSITEGWSQFRLKFFYQRICLPGYWRANDTANAFCVFGKM